MQRKWRRDWERGKIRHITKAGPPVSPLKALAKSIFMPVVAAGILLGSMTGVYANPTGGTVVSGAGTISSSGSAMTINQTTDKLGINWQSFSIGTGEKVQFIQPGSTSIALNRVIGNEASSIYGTLTANGKVFLINQNGILFAPGSKVDVGGLVASTLDISDSDFQNGNYKFTGRDGMIGTVVNQGTITATSGGYVALLGPQVANEGVIVANKGTVALGAGQAITLDMDGDGLLNLAVDQAAVNASAANHNLIQADGGQVIMVASAAGDLAGTVVNNSGVIQARSVSNVNGVIRLDGGTNGTVVNSGTLDASGKNAGETGGTVKVLGNTVTLADNAKVDVSGLNGGGTALIGGNYQGKGTEQNATTTTVAATATINADAITSGNGGKVVVWANDTTNYYGNISAKGGVVSGNGGSAEVSGKKTLLYKGYTDLRAANGTTGTLLLDPGEYTISTDNTSGNVYNATDLSTQLGSANITLQTDGTGTGDITVAAPVSWASGNSLTLKANNDINVNAAIANSGSGGVTLKANNDINVNANITNSGSGGVTLKAGKDINVNATITTGSGSVVLRADSDANDTGTVTFGTSGKVVSDGAVSIYYNPSGTKTTTINGTDTAVKDYTSPTDYSSYVQNTSGSTGNLTAYMLVNNLKELQAVNLNLAGTYALGTDIDAGASSSWNNGAGFVPIGSSSSAFTGIFDGDGHVISGLNIYSSSNIDSNGTPVDVGLFADTAYGSTIRNVGLENVNITGTWASGGALVGYNSSTITNCYSTGAITATGNSMYTGGLVGNNYASAITNSYSTVAVSGTDITQGGAAIGGLVGYNNGTITNTYSTGAVNVTSGIDHSLYVGGLVGLTSGTLTNSYSTGAVTLTNLVPITGTGLIAEPRVGGLAGQATGTLQNCYTTSQVTINGDNSYVGGLVGVGIGITNSYSTGLITNNGSGNTVGGLAGYSLNGRITSSYWDTDTSGITDTTQGVGNISSYTGVTGLTTAQMMDKTYLTNLGFDFTGIWYMMDGATRPFLQSEYSTTINNAHQLQLMDMHPDASYTLGNNIDLSGLFTNVAGMWNTATGFVPIGSQSTPFTGTFDGSGYSISGLTITSPAVSAVGLFGYLSGATVSDVGLTGLTITGGAGNTYVGGLAGYNDGSTITDVYTTGTVSGGVNTGGLVGWNNGNVTKSYSMSTVSGDNNVGGLAGTNTGTIANSYFDAAGTVSGGAASKAGGIAGANGGTVNGTAVYGTIATSYNAGVVAGGTAGGLVGDGAGGTITASVWDTTTSGTTNGVGSDAAATGVTGLSTTQMGDSTNYPSGWDFTDTWSLTGARPLLRWELNGRSTIITTLDQLLAISNNLSGVYILAADIDLTGVVWTPIGGSDTTSFTGILKGNGYTISELTITSSSSSALGLFGYTKGATISSVNLTDVNIVAGTGNLYVGSLVGYSGTGTSITGCTSAGTITASGAGSTVGGLVGYNAGSIDASSSSATVTVTGAGSMAGGLAGWNAADGVITSSYNTGAVTSDADSNFAGGLVGENDGSIGSSYNTGVVTTTTNATNNRVGGLVGKNNSSITASVTSSYNTGAVTGNGSSSYIGGLVGENASGGIINSYNTGAVTNSGNNSYVGGLVGADSGAITSAYNTGAVTSSADNGDVGGLVGRNNSTITDSYNFARVTANGAASKVGGLVGLNNIGSAVTASYATVTVTANGAGSTVGGLVGENDGSVTNSYSMLKTTGTGAGSTVGGLVGLNAAGGTIASSFSVGAVTGSTAGGLVGVNNGTITDAVWAIDTSGQTSGVGSGSAIGVQGLNWTGMLNSTNFATWDTGTWSMTNGLLPYLNWQYSSTPTKVFTGTVSGGSGELVNVVWDGTQVAQGYEFGANGFYYAVGTPKTSYGSGANSVLLYVAGDSNYKATSVYWDNGTGLSGGDLVKDTLTIGGGSKGISNDQLYYATGNGKLTTSDIIYSIAGGYNMTVNGSVQATNYLFGHSYNLINQNLTATGSITINNPGDVILNNNFNYDNSNQDALANQQITAGGDITIIAGGNIIIRHGATNYTELTAGGNITLVAGTGFVNDSGSKAIVSGGRWLIYAPDQLIYSSDTTLYTLERFYGIGRPDTINGTISSNELTYDVRGGLVGDFVQWGTTYGQSIPSSGSGFIFTAANPMTRALSPTQLERNAAISEAHGYNIQRLGALVAPAVAQGFSLDTLPFLTIVGQGVAVGSGAANNHVTVEQQTEADTIN